MVLDLRIPQTKRVPAGRARHGARPVPRRRARRGRHDAADHRRLERDHRRGRAGTSSSPRTSPALASSDNSIDTEPGESDPGRSAPRARATRRATSSLGAWRSDGAARWVFIWPTVLVILFLSIFPLVASLALSLSKLAFEQGGVDLDFVGFTNYADAALRRRAQPLPGRPQAAQRLGWAIVALASCSASAGRSCASRPQSGRVRPVRPRPPAVGGLLLRRLPLAARRRRSPATAAGRAP